MLYKHISFFVAILGVGYTVKQIAGLVSRAAENNDVEKKEKSNEKLKDHECLEDESVECEDFYYRDGDVDINKLKAFFTLKDGVVTYSLCDLSCSSDIASSFIGISYQKLSRELTYQEAIPLVREARQDFDERSGLISRIEAWNIFERNLRNSL